MIRILITGGTGFIGRKLCKNLIDHRHSVTVLSRKPERVASICGEQAMAITSLSLLSADSHFDILVNLAGEPIADKRWTKKRRRQIRSSRIGVTKQLVNYIAAADHKPRVLVSGSAIGYYGNQGSKLLDETSSFVSDFGHQLCAEWENAGMQAANLGVRVCILRTGLVIAEGGGFLQRMLTPFKLGLGGKLGDGKQWMSWIHRNDLAAMIEHLINTPKLHGVFNGTAPNPVTNEQFTQDLAKTLNRPAILPAPAFALKLMLGEMSSLLLEGQRVIPQRFQDEGFKFRFEHLVEALGSALTAA